jgi:hypothetical protein
VNIDADELRAKIEQELQGICDVFGDSPVSVADGFVSQMTALVPGYEWGYKRDPENPNHVTVSVRIPVPMEWVTLTIRTPTDEADGMLLADLLSPATLEYIERVKNGGPSRVKRGTK